MLAFEKQVLGFYVTSNPLSHCAEKINLYSTVNSSELDQVDENKSIFIGGMITRTRYNVIKNGKNAGAKMAVFVLEDLQGQVEVVVFPRTLKQCAGLIENDKVVFVKGRVDRKREKPNVLASELIGIDDIGDKIATRVRIDIDSNIVTPEAVAQIKSICLHHQGKSPVYVAVHTDKGKVFASAANSLAVNPDVDFCKKIRHIVGDKNVQLTR